LRIFICRSIQNRFVRTIDAHPNWLMSHAGVSQGSPSKSMQANEALFVIAQLIRADATLKYMTIVTPPQFLMAKLRGGHTAAATAVVAAMEGYLERFGHQVCPWGRAGWFCVARALQRAAAPRTLVHPTAVMGTCRDTRWTLLSRHRWRTLRLYSRLCV
jgi:hypothetical protein